MINFALVGCGRISKRHSELLGENQVAGAQLVAVCDKNAYQKVLKQVSAQVPDMSKVVDSWSAGIDANLVIYKRFKRANFTFVGIK